MERDGALKRCRDHFKELIGDYDVRDTGTIG